MKISIKSFVSLCVIYFLASGLATAEPADVVKIDETGCWMLAEVGFIQGDLHQVSVNNENGNIKVSCSQDLDPTSTGRSIIYNYDNTGIECGAMGHPTKDWHQVISSDGQAKLTCHYKDDE